jgi:imidazoleglycerol-phosphate dehydratase/histidinol-phosphatase
MNVAFLDRDGTLIYEPPEGLVQPKDFRILPGVLETLKKLQDQGYVLVLVTNQNFTKGPQNEECFHVTQKMLQASLSDAGITFHSMFLCPHAQEQNCHCQKPKTGMVDDFLAKHAVDLQRSFVVGDREANDGGLAENIGVRYVKLEPNGTFPTFEQLLS